MLTIDVPKRELFNQITNEFFVIEPIHLKMEHSLRSIAEWESKWHIPYVNDNEDEPKTEEQVLDYFRCMTINPQKDVNVYRNLRACDLKKIAEYIDDPSTAKVFRKKKKTGKQTGGTMTAENYYFLMVHYGIPFDCDKWHFNRKWKHYSSWKKDDSGSDIEVLCRD